MLKASATMTAALLLFAVPWAVAADLPKFCSRRLVVGTAGPYPPFLEIDGAIVRGVDVLVARKVYDGVCGGGKDMQPSFVNSDTLEEAFARLREKETDVVIAAVGFDQTAPGREGLLHSLPYAKSDLGILASSATAEVFQKVLRSTSAAIAVTNRATMFRAVLKEKKTLRVVTEKNSYADRYLTALKASMGDSGESLILDKAPASGVAPGNVLFMAQQTDMVVGDAPYLQEIATSLKDWTLVQCPESGPTAGAGATEALPCSLARQDVVIVVRAEDSDLLKRINLAVADMHDYHGRGGLRFLGTQEMNASGRGALIQPRSLFWRRVAASEVRLNLSFQNVFNSVRGQSNTKTWEVDPAIKFDFPALTDYGWLYADYFKVTHVSAKASYMFRSVDNTALTGKSETQTADITIGPKVNVIIPWWRRTFDVTVSTGYGWLLSQSQEFDSGSAPAREAGHYLPLSVEGEFAVGKRLSLTLNWSQKTSRGFKVKFDNSVKAGFSYRIK